jgi:hypothetical protein
MGTKLRNNLTIRTLAADLKLKLAGDVVAEIIAFCHKRVRRFLDGFGECPSTDQLLEIVSNKVGTVFREVHTNQDLEQVRAEFLNKKEAGFVSLHKELNGGVLGITLKRQMAEPWELPYVSIIDCRGENKIRANYTKWHEIVHLLLLTDQSRLVFRRTHAEKWNNPEEALVDVVAGSLAFFAPLVQAHARGEISFEKIEEVRAKISPSASRQSALIGISKAWPTPCVLLHAQLDYKAGEVSAQHNLGFVKPPRRNLRATHVSVNDAARKLGVKVIPKFRVPTASVIHRVFYDGAEYAEAQEELGSWVSSSGCAWEGGTVLVKAKNYGEYVQALLVPIGRGKRER